MSELDDLRRRIDRLEARAEIGALATAYALACDEHDMPRLISLFSEDAQFDSPSGLMKARGLREIAEMFIGMLRIRGPAYHWTHDHVIEFGTNQDEATGLLLSHAETCPNNEVSLAAMRYHDKYVRVKGRWLFAARTIKFLYYVPARDFPAVFSKTNRITVGGKSLPADFPETLPAWQEFARAHVNAAKS
jgi:hypothetical protein